MNILITGGAGYIGSHNAVLLGKLGHHITIYDDLSNSKKSFINNIKDITRAPIVFIEGDVRDTELLSRALTDHSIELVIHCAGLKSVDQSVEEPLLYFDNNVGGAISLLDAMKRNGVRKLIFSSSATVYGSPKYLPYDENHPLNPTNPYGRSKKIIEEILYDISTAEKDWSIVCLRYFNPVGAHSSSLIGENPTGIPNNLLPYISRVASGLLPRLNLYGGDYDTKDGTGERDYIHVMDLAEGHLAAIDFLNVNNGWYAFNLGTGNSYSVLEVVKTFERVCGKKIPYEFSPRRPGDLPVCFSKAELAKDLLGWRATRDLDQMCKSAWDYQVKLRE